MSSVDFSAYTTIEQLAEDIKNIKIQGATNVAIATMRGIELSLKKFDSLEGSMEVGDRLSKLRPNEPLAKNGVRYVSVMYKIKGARFTLEEDKKNLVSQLCSEYLNLIESGKTKIVESSEALGEGVRNAVTHCHSSTVEKILINYSKKNKDFAVFCTETRPLFQGRITATNLLKGGVDTTLMADSAVESIIIGRGNEPIDIVFIGADEITLNGDAINKVGSFGVALASYYASKPLYVVMSLLKVNPQTAFKTAEIEMRGPQEIWENPPAGLKIYNPAFEVVPKDMITGYITEFGIIKPNEVASVVHKNYDWIF